MDEAAAETIQSDQPCAKCGYSLRTLRVDGVCPECGYAVAESLISAQDRLILLAEERVLAAKAWHERWNRRLPVIAAVAVLAFVVGVPLGANLLPESRGDERFDFAVLAWTLCNHAFLFLSIASLIAWYGCGVRLSHAAYIEQARSSGDRSREGVKRRRDDRVARREEIYRRNIGAAKALIVLFLFGVTCMAATTLQFFDTATLSIRPPFVLQIVSTMQWLVILFIMMWINQGRLAQAQSIRLYRRRERAAGAGG